MLNGKTRSRGLRLILVALAVLAGLGCWGLPTPWLRAGTGGLSAASPSRVRSRVSRSTGPLAGTAAAGLSSRSSRPADAATGTALLGASAGPTTSACSSSSGSSRRPKAADRTGSCCPSSRPTCARLERSLEYGADPTRPRRLLGSVFILQDAAPNPALRAAQRRCRKHAATLGRARWSAPTDPGHAR